MLTVGAALLVSSGLSSTALAQAGCQVLEESKTIPAIDALFDSAALVAALPAADAAAPSEMVFTVLTGARPIVQNVDSTNKFAVSGLTMNQLVATSRPGSRSFAPAFKVRVVLGEAGRPQSMRAEHSTLCPPSRIGSASPPQIRRTVMTPAGSGPPPRPRPVTPRLQIGVGGQVMRVDLGSGSGDRDLDRAIDDAERRSRFRPALLDGRPIEVWLSGTKVEIAR